MARILIVDDDPSIREVVRFALAHAGFDTLEAGNGTEGLRLARDADPDVLVLDVMMPEMDGSALCRSLRALPGPAATIPVLFLSSRGDEVARIVGLEIGGDDYLVKPFSPRELVARVRALLRRGPLAAPAPQGDVRLCHGRLALDPDRIRVTWDEWDVTLTATEFGLLRALMRRPGLVLNREALMDGAYDTQRIVADRTVDSHIRRLRAKFAPFGADPVETLPGFGYRLGPCR